MGKTDPPWYFPWCAGTAGIVVQSACANLFPYKMMLPTPLPRPTKVCSQPKAVPLQNDPVLEALSLEGVQKMPMIRSNIFFVGSSDFQQKHEKLVCQHLLFCRETIVFLNSFKTFSVACCKKACCKKTRSRARVPWLVSILCKIPRWSPHYHL